MQDPVQVWCAISMITTVRRRTVAICLIHLAGGALPGDSPHHMQSPHHLLASTGSMSAPPCSMHPAGASLAGTVQSCRAKAVEFNSILMRQVHLGRKVCCCSQCSMLCNASGVEGVASLDISRQGQCHAPSLRTHAHCVHAAAKGGGAGSGRQAGGPGDLRLHLTSHWGSPAGAQWNINRPVRGGWSAR
jgi:hypothetical protein